MRLIASTVVRESIRGKQKTGFLYDVDWDAGEILRRLPVRDPLYPQTDDNPRGGVRGGRGIAVTSAGIVVANYDTLLRYDDDWTLLDELSHPLFVGLHEIDWDGRHVWAAATAIDAVLRVDLDGHVEVAWDPHAPHLAQAFGVRRRPHPVDGSVDYRIREAPLLDNCHVNGVARYDGFTVVNCGLVRKPRSAMSRLLERGKTRLQRGGRRNREARGVRRHRARSLVVRVDSDREAEVLLELPNVDFPTHNGQLIAGDRVAINDSTRNTLRVYKREAGEVQTVGVAGTWLRGLEPLDGSRLFVGSAPAAIVLVNLDEGAIESTLRLSEDPNEAVHGLTICPPEEERR